VELALSQLVSSSVSLMIKMMLLHADLLLMLALCGDNLIQRVERRCPCNTIPTPTL
jgi:hypothetical protein